MWKSGNGQRRRTIGAGILFGVAIGAALGIVLGQLVLGMGVGIALAAAALAVSSRRPDRAGKSKLRSSSDRGGGWA